MRTQSNRTKLAAIAVALCSVASSFPADKVKLEGSTSLELPRPKSIESRNGVTFEAEGPTLEGGFAAPPPQVNPGAEKKLKEMLDKKRNWIFMNPYEDNYDSKTEEILGSRDEKDSDLEKKATGERDKSLVEKFITGDKENSSDRDNRSTRRTRLDERKTGSERESRADQEEDRRSTFLSAEREKRSDSVLFPGDLKKPSFLAGENGMLEKVDSLRSTDNVFARERFDSRKALLGTREAVKVEKEDQRGAELDKMMQPRELGPGFASKFDPINTQVDSTRQEINPITASRFEPVKSPDFAPKRSFLSESEPVAQRALPEASSFGDVMPKAPSISPVTPSFNPPAVSAPAPMAPRPFVFEIPKRAF